MAANIASEGIKTVGDNHIIPSQQKEGSFSIFDSLIDNIDNSDIIGAAVTDCEFNDVVEQKEGSFSIFDSLLDESINSADTIIDGAANEYAEYDGDDYIIDQAEVAGSTIYHEEVNIPANIINQEVTMSTNDEYNIEGSSDIVLGCNESEDNIYDCTQ